MAFLVLQGLGYGAVVFGVFNCFLGVALADNLGLDTGFFVIALFMLFGVCGMIGFVGFLQYKRMTGGKDETGTTTSV